MLAPLGMRLFLKDVGARAPLDPLPNPWLALAVRLPVVQGAVPVAMSDEKKNMSVTLLLYNRGTWAARAITSIEVRTDCDLGPTCNVDVRCRVDPGNTPQD